MKNRQISIEQILNSAYDGIASVDKDGKVILFNDAAKRIFHVTGNPLGKHISEISPIARMPEVMKDAVAEINHITKIDRNTTVMTSRMPILDEYGQVIGAVAIFREIPQLEELSEKLKGSIAVAYDLTELLSLNRELDNAKRVIRGLKGKYSFEDILGRNKYLKEAIEKAKRAAKTSAPILLIGDSGTGKELFAHAIHNESSRASKPFVRVNCAAISESILESELFGYEEGAFTGAKKTGKKGYFEQADHGTVFLDEIGKISLSLQAKLLRVLQEKEIIRVGASSPISVDVRIVAAANNDLEAEIARGNFREDLYYRLNMVPIHLPSLKERIDDIGILSDHMISLYNEEYGRKVTGITAEALSLLKQKEWRGNIRELSNYIGRTMIDMDPAKTQIETGDLPDSDLKEKIIPLPEHTSETVIPLSQVIRDAEKTYIEKILKQNKGNKTKTAKQLKISIRSLYNKLQN